MYFVYILKSLTKGTYYKGLTKDLGKRINEHNSGKTSSNRSLRPFMLVFVQEFETLAEARAFEKYMKSGYGREIIKEIDD